MVILPVQLMRLPSDFCIKKLAKPSATRKRAREYQ
ncbi:MAG: hypothetical protein ACD_75C01551G0003 [uncultured bacterium]|nr:MAG: hypothetical protein ACD_75C01551G0003 [uncultured bacterium]